MPISLQQFRDKVQAGDAERLEVNRAGTGLHRKGMSAGGRAVEWLRDAVGMRKAENQRVTTDFVAALKAEHGNVIGDKAQNVLQGHESKPLSSRQVRQLISDADTLRNSMRRKNEALAQLYAPGQQNDRALGYMSAVLAANRRPAPAKIWWRRCSTTAVVQPTGPSAPGDPGRDRGRG